MFGCRLDILRTIKNTINSGKRFQRLVSKLHQPLLWAGPDRSWNRIDYESGCHRRKHGTCFSWKLYCLHPEIFVGRVNETTFLRTQKKSTHPIEEQNGAARRGKQDVENHSMQFRSHISNKKLEVDVCKEERKSEKQKYFLQERKRKIWRPLGNEDSRRIAQLFKERERSHVNLDCDRLQFVWEKPHKNTK